MEHIETETVATPKVRGNITNHGYLAILQESTLNHCFRLVSEYKEFFLQRFSFKASSEAQIDVNGFDEPQPKSLENISSTATIERESFEACGIEEACTVEPIIDKHNVTEISDTLISGDESLSNSELNLDSGFDSKPQIKVETECKDSNTPNEIKQIFSLETIDSDVRNYPSISIPAYQKVYTDGSCLNNGKRYAKAGYGVFYEYNTNRNISKRLIGFQCSFHAELQAINHALDNAITDAKNGYLKKIQIYTDCQAGIRHIYGPHNGYKNRYSHIIRECRKKINTLTTWHVEVGIYKVPAHCGVYGNIEADRLAREGAVRH